MSATANKDGSKTYSGAIGSITINKGKVSHGGPPSSSSGSGGRNSGASPGGGNRNAGGGGSSLADKKRESGKRTADYWDRVTSGGGGSNRGSQSGDKSGKIDNNRSSSGGGGRAAQDEFNQRVDDTQRKMGTGRYGRGGSRDIHAESKAQAAAKVQAEREIFGEKNRAAGPISAGHRLSERSRITSVTGFAPKITSAEISARQRQIISQKAKDEIINQRQLEKETGQNQTPGTYTRLADNMGIGIEMGGNTRKANIFDSKRGRGTGESDEERQERLQQEFFQRTGKDPSEPKPTQEAGFSFSISKPPTASVENFDVFAGGIDVQGNKATIKPQESIGFFAEGQTSFNKTTGEVSYTPTEAEAAKFFGMSQTYKLPAAALTKVRSEAITELQKEGGVLTQERIDAATAELLETKYADGIPMSAGKVSSEDLNLAHDIFTGKKDQTTFFGSMSVAKGRDLFSSSNTKQGQSRQSQQGSVSEVADFSIAVPSSNIGMRRSSPFAVEEYGPSGEIVPTTLFGVDDKGNRVTLPFGPGVRETESVKSELVKDLPKSSGNFLTDVYQGLEAGASNLWEGTVKPGLSGMGLGFGAFGTIGRPEKAKDLIKRADEIGREAESKLRPDLEGDLIGLGVQGGVQQIATGKTDVTQADFGKVFSRTTQNPGYSIGNIGFSALSALFPSSKATSALKGIGGVAKSGVGKIATTVEKSIGETALAASIGGRSTAAKIKASRPADSIYNFFVDYGRMGQAQKEVAPIVQRAEAMEAGKVTGLVSQEQPLGGVFSTSKRFSRPTTEADALGMTSEQFASVYGKAQKRQGTEATEQLLTDVVSVKSLGIAGSDLAKTTVGKVEPNALGVIISQPGKAKPRVQVPGSKRTVPVFGAGEDTTTPIELLAGGKSPIPQAFAEEAPAVSSAASASAFGVLGIEPGKISPRVVIQGQKRSVPAFGFGESTVTPIEQLAARKSPLGDFVKQQEDLFGSGGSTTKNVDETTASLFGAIGVEPGRAAPRVVVPGQRRSISAFGFGEETVTPIESLVSGRAPLVTSKETDDLAKALDDSSASTFGALGVEAGETSPRTFVPGSGRSVESLGFGESTVTPDELLVSGKNPLGEIGEGAAGDMGLKIEREKNPGGRSPVSGKPRGRPTEVDDALRNLGVGRAVDRERGKSELAKMLSKSDRKRLGLEGPSDVEITPGPIFAKDVVKQFGRAAPTTGAGQTAAKPLTAQERLALNRTIQADASRDPIQALLGSPEKVVKEAPAKRLSKRERNEINSALMEDSQNPLANVLSRIESESAKMRKRSSRQTSAPSESGFGFGASEKGSGGLVLLLKETEKQATKKSLKAKTEEKLASSLGFPDLSKGTSEAGSVFGTPNKNKLKGVKVSNVNTLEKESLGLFGATGVEKVMARRRKQQQDDYGFSQVTAEDMGFGQGTGVESLLGNLLGDRSKTGSRQGPTSRTGTSQSPTFTFDFGFDLDQGQSQFSRSGSPSMPTPKQETGAFFDFAQFTALDNMFKTPPSKTPMDLRFPSAAGKKKKKDRDDDALKQFKREWGIFDILSGSGVKIRTDDFDLF